MSRMSSIKRTLGRKIGILALGLGAILQANMAWGEGTMTSGGGNAIRCDDGKLYAWDYVNIHFGAVQIDPFNENAKSATEILRNIAKHLRAKLPMMADSLTDFLRFNKDLFAKSSNRVWLPGTNPLLPVGDEDRIRIPKTCVAKADESFKLYQAVVRTAPGKIMYAYDPILIDELEKNKPLQLSFLYLHEWLRDYTSKARVLTYVNQVLHGTQWKKQDAIELYKMLTSLGLKATPPRAAEWQCSYENCESNGRTQEEAENELYQVCGAPSSPCDNMSPQARMAYARAGGNCNDVPPTECKMVMTSGYKPNSWTGKPSKSPKENKEDNSRTKGDAFDFLLNPGGGK